MPVSKPRIIICSFGDAAEQTSLSHQLSDIGYNQTHKANDLKHLKQLVCETVNPVVVLQLTDKRAYQTEIDTFLSITKSIPVIGVLSKDYPFTDQRVISAFHEVVVLPCSNQELDFRMRKFAPNIHGKDDLVQNIFTKMNILGNSDAFQKVLGDIYKISNSNIPVLVDGETGTGKELIARAIHYSSHRQNQPFIAANCGALPDHLIENELFGHEKGAYTDARESYCGIIGLAEGGTLFLDEIETLSTKGQITLLRFLEDMQYRSVGGKKFKQANVRVIVATNESISGLVEKGTFRKDLYYRINVMNIKLPPLRERPDDIKILAEHFIRRYQKQYQQPEKELHPETLYGLIYHDWPGNVRELENVLHREFLLTEGKYIRMQEYENGIRERRANHGDRRYQRLFRRSMVEAKKELINEFEELYLMATLTRANGNISMAARLAGKERRSFSRLLEKHHLCDKKA